MKSNLIFIITFFLFSCGQRVEKNESKVNNQIISSEDITYNNLTNSSKKHSSESQSNNLINIKNCDYDNDVSSLGIGLTIAPDTFTVYNDSLLKIKHSSYNIYSDVDSDSSICSKFYKPDYGIMHFICLEKTDKAYKVLINYSDVKFLPNTKNYKFKSWNDYILNSFSIRRLTTEKGNISNNLPLKKEPQDAADTLKIPKGHEMFCPLEIKGDWVKVKYDCFYNEENNPHEGEPCYQYIDKCNYPLIGWLRWKRGNKLLIDIFLMP